MLSFQLVLILSGNLAFLNWLTIVPVMALVIELCGRVLGQAARRRAA